MPQDLIAKYRSKKCAHFQSLSKVKLGVKFTAAGSGTLLYGLDTINYLYNQDDKLDASKLQSALGLESIIIEGIVVWYPRNPPKSCKAQRTRGPMPSNVEPPKKRIKLDLLEESSKVEVRSQDEFPKKAIKFLLDFPSEFALYSEHHGRTKKTQIDRAQGIFRPEPDYQGNV